MKEQDDLRRQYADIQHKSEMIASVKKYVDEINVQKIKLDELRNRRLRLQTESETFVVSRSTVEIDVDLEKVRKSNENAMREIGRNYNKVDSARTTLKNLRDESLRINTVLNDRFNGEIKAGNSQSAIIGLIGESIKMVDEALKELFIAKNAKEIYSNYYDCKQNSEKNDIADSIAKKKCAFCTRHFATKDEINNFSKNIEKRLEELPSQIIELEKVLDVKKNEHSELER